MGTRDEDPDICPFVSRLAAASIAESGMRRGRDGCMVDAWWMYGECMEEGKVRAVTKRLDLASRG
jgi:hypothetical protein